MFKTSLQLKHSQNLSLTPQLQQSLHFLQLSTLELEQTLHNLVLENPFLKIIDEYNPVESDHLIKENSLFSHEPDSTNEISTGVSNSTDATFEDYSAPLEPNSFEQLSGEHISNELVLDSQWEDYYQDDNMTHESSFSSGSQEDTGFDVALNKAIPLSLKSHLLEQLLLTPFTECEQLIGYHIIESLDQDGYLTLSEDELIEGLTRQNNQYDYKSDYHSVLKRIQRFDPFSMATENLSQRLILQLEQFSRTDSISIAIKVLKEASHLLEKRDFRTIQKQLQISQLSLEQALKALALLDPFPAKHFSENTITIEEPDIIVENHAGKWQVRLNNSNFPKIELDSDYVKMLQIQKKNKQKHDEVQKNTVEYLQDAYQNAKTVLYSLEGRYKTLLLVANQIVASQIDFFDKGEGYLKPLTLSSIANILEMSESTISRACQNKFLFCARGLYELKYFFSSHVNNSDGDDVSSHVIKSHIKQWIEEENKIKPLSDSKLEAKLKDAGFEVARRTVAKYREQLGFSPSHLRKMI